jgi:hypothetical protein
MEKNMKQYTPSDALRNGCGGIGKFTDHCSIMEPPHAVWMRPIGVPTKVMGGVMGGFVWVSDVNSGASTRVECDKLKVV